MLNRMGFFDSGRRVSVDSLSLEVAKLVIGETLDGPDSLDSRFRTMGWMSRMPTDNYFLETVVAGLFTFDLMLALDHGESATPVRARVRELVLVAVNTSRRDIGSAELGNAQWNQLVEARLGQYAAAFQSAEGANGMQAFAMSAAKRICGSDVADMGVAMAIAIKFASAMKALRPALKSYSISK